MTSIWRQCFNMYAFKENVFSEKGGWKQSKHFQLRQFSKKTEIQQSIVIGSVRAETWRRLLHISDSWQSGRKTWENSDFLLIQTKGYGAGSIGN